MLTKQSSVSKSVTKTVLAATSLSILLLLSGCSDDKAVATTDTIQEPTATDEPTISVEAPVAETEAVTPEAIAEVESTETTAIEEAVPEVTAETEVLAADAGATLYESNCKVCHAAGLLNAPKYGDTAAWTARLTKDKETLYMHSAKGFNKMPAQAVNGVTEAQVKAAVDYMLASVS